MNYREIINKDPQGAKEAAEKIGVHVYSLSKLPEELERQYRTKDFERAYYRYVKR